MTAADIKEVVGQFVRSAELAMEAGFDGVEIHGANGYLPNQFIATNSNTRTDEYGGSVENRCRFLLEITDQVAEKIGAGKVGVRLSPVGHFNDIQDEAVEENYTYLYQEIGKRNLAYLHIVESFPGMEPSLEEQALIKKLRQNFKGCYIANGNYTAETADELIASGEAFAIAFGRSFLANPDLPERIKSGAPLNEPNPATFYGGGTESYTDYPTMNA